METIEAIELERVETQQKLDSAKTQLERNKLGQFATPTPLARDILNYAKKLFPEGEKINFFDPAFGTGAFYSALLSIFPANQIASARGYEIDPYYGKRALDLWTDTPLELHIEDFTKANPSSELSKSNLVICNPPYVRHHHLNDDDKRRLQRITKQKVGVHLNRLAGLYCHFLCLSHAWMKEDGVAGWLIPSEFMDVNYGQQLKHYLLNSVTLLRIHRFDPNDVQFQDALVSSAVVWFKKGLPPIGHSVEMTFGGTLVNPKTTKTFSIPTLQNAKKWNHLIVSDRVSHINGQSHTALGELFNVKRGLATGANQFFILTEEKVKELRLPKRFLKPILPSPRNLSVDEVRANKDGLPILEPKLFLLSCDLKENEVRANYPLLWNYLTLGIKTKINEGYLCKNRNPWYAQENRPSPLFLCTYMGRQRNCNARPFRFILNHSIATAANVYLLLYPKPELQKMLKNKPKLKRTLWTALNNISPDNLMREGRVYGGGLHKMEPRELTNVSADGILPLLS